MTNPYELGDQGDSNRGGFWLGGGARGQVWFGGGARLLQALLNAEIQLSVTTSIGILFLVRLLLLLLVSGLRQQGNQLLVFKRKVARNIRRRYTPRDACDVTGGEKQCCEFDLSNELAWLFEEDGVLDEEAVLDTFGDTQPPTALISSSQRKWESRKPLVHLREERTRRLHFQAVLLLQVTLKHGRSGVIVFWFTLTRANNNVNSEDVIYCQLFLFDLMI